MSAPKILVIRFSSIGDIVLTSPVVRCLCQQLGAEVHFLVKQSFKAVVEHNPYIARVHTIQRHVREVLPVLQAERFDFVVDLHHNLRSLQVKLALGAPANSFHKLNLEKWLLVNLRINCLPELHIVDRYMAAAAPLGIQYDGQGLDYFLPESDEQAALQWLSQHLGAAHASYIAFVIGAAHATKRLPEARIAELCRMMEKPIVLLGGPDEQAQGEYIAAQAGSHVVNACGQLSLHQSAAAVKHAAKVITHDTGLMHIAAAFHKDILSIWGNTVPAFGMTPFYPKGIQRNTTIEVQNLPCRPCSKIGYDTCPRGHFKCMMEINLQQVANLVG